MNGLQILEEEQMYRQQQEHSLQQQQQVTHVGSIPTPYINEPQQYDFTPTEPNIIVPVEGTTTLQDEIEAMINYAPNNMPSDHSIPQVSLRA